MEKANEYKSLWYMIFKSFSEYYYGHSSLTHGHLKHLSYFFLNNKKDIDLRKRNRNEKNIICCSSNFRLECIPFSFSNNNLQLK